MIASWRETIRRAWHGHGRSVMTIGGANADRIIDSIREESAGMRMLTASDLMSIAQQHRCASASIKAPNASVTAHRRRSIAFACEAIRRGLDVEAYDVQLIAGAAMVDGGIAEMQTGEGKTIAGTIPAIVHALAGQQVHVATTSSYLAQRDQCLLKPVFESLGLTTGLSDADQSTDDKAAAYQCDVTYATGYQLGFDYLRDQLGLASDGPRVLGRRLRQSLSHAQPSQNRVQRNHHVAIIDEVDSVLIDEAMTPLVLSASQLNGSLSNNLDLAKVVAKWAHETALRMEPSSHFVVNHEDKSMRMTESGKRFAAEQFNQLTTSMTSPDNANASSNWGLTRPWNGYVTAALRANHLLKRNVDYVVRDDEIQIVDGPTGRIVPDRQWNEGLHQAVQTLEGVTITEERQTMARISRQRYFGRYALLCGMTGTAGNQARNWLDTYSMQVHSIPTRLPSQRNELPTQYFAASADKLGYIQSDVAKRQSTGQPVLIGTQSIEQTLQVSAALTGAGISHRMLNGLQDEPESELVSIAGRSGAVTVATNMAGRGTDIVPDEQAIATGGLHVIGIERNHSSRVDRQLLGRSGRQGQPGSGQFLVSADDTLVVRYDPAFRSRLSKLSAATSNRDWDRHIMNLQQTAEREQTEIREAMVRNETQLNLLRHQVA
ncbi:MAG: preprotein translocase subunit SecA [Rubripirellula sp.]